MPEKELDINSDPDNTKGEDGKKSVPLEALEAERSKRHALEREVAEIRGQLKGLSAQPAKADTQPKPLTPAELRAAVDEGKITQGEADELRERQFEERLLNKVTKTVETSLSTATRTSTINGELGRYQAALPDLGDRDSEAFRKAKREFDYLVGTLGEDPDDPRTELKAARAAFGPVDALEAVRQRGRETYGETGGHGDSRDDGRRKDGSPKDMSADHRAYYQDLINKGVYRDWKAVAEEWSYKPKNRPNVRAHA